MIVKINGAVVKPIIDTVVPIATTIQAGNVVNNWVDTWKEMGGYWWDDGLIKEFARLVEQCEELADANQGTVGGTMFRLGELVGKLIELVGHTLEWLFFKLPRVLCDIKVIAAIIGLFLLRRYVSVMLIEVLESVTPSRPGLSKAGRRFLVGKNITEAATLLFQVLFA